VARAERQPISTCTTPTSGAYPEPPPGQVGLFDWDGTDLFTLDTFTLRLAFHAPRAEVTFRPN
jgi:hypothetical protein